MSNDLGIDRSGNDNSWTVNNMAFSDQVVDSPTNNFATWNPLQYGWNYTPVYTEGNTKISFTNAGAYGHGYGTIGGLKSGKWYWETLVNAQGTDTRIGIAGQVTGSDGEADVWRQYIDNLNDGNGKNKNGGFDNSYGSSFTSGDIIGLAVDIDNGTIAFYKNNSSQGTAYTDILSAMPDDGWMPHSSGYNTSTITTNFGQDSSFAGAKTAQGNQDGNDIGDFYYTPPTGFLALCTSNLPEPAVKPAENFNTVIYTGNATARSITGVGFQPDWVWIKNRAATENHTIYDVLRGAEIRLASDANDGEDDRGSYGLTAFGADGFTIGTGGELNGNNQAIVAWNWKAGGSGVSASNLTGVGTATISANTDAGFSIVQWTSTQGGPVSYGHGLSQTPEFVITKSVTDDDYWGVGHKELGWTKALNLNDRRSPVTSSSYWNNTAPTSTIVTLGGAVNNAKRFITYNFHSVDGYQKFGKYLGNQSDDGPFIYLGFKPAYLVIFSITTQDDGHLILDAAREPDNRVDLLLYVSNNDAEADNSGTTGTSSRGIDFVSNGFKIRGANSLVNYSSREYAYWAIAETPFKHSNAR